VDIGDVYCRIETAIVCIEHGSSFLSIEGFTPGDVESEADALNRLTARLDDGGILDNSEWLEANSRQRRVKIILAAFK
jgi:hypothetical protein